MAKNPMNRIIILLFILSLILSSSVHAVHKGAGDIVCGGCHTMHNSQGNASLEGNPSIVLLRGAVTTRAQIHKLCLQCHASNGAQATTVHAPQNVIAPKVYSIGAWTENDAFNLIGAGGNFSTELGSNWDVTTTATLGYGHSLGATSVTPPGGEADPSISEFSCTNCHDPHGTSNTADTAISIFRNLKVNPTGAGANSGIKFVNDPTRTYREHHSYVGGVNGTYFGGTELDNGGNVIWPVYKRVP